jgi:hypothetical protein
MINSQSLPKCLGLMALMLACCSLAAQAQTTIFNVPSTDVQATHKTYAEVDFIGHLTSLDNGGFQVYGAKLLYGARKGVEGGMNVFYTRAEGAAKAVELQPNAKWQFYQNEEKGVALAAGGEAFVTTPHRLSDTFGLVYLTASKKVKATHGPRITGGTYRLLGLNAGSGTKGGGLLGYEQPVTTRLNFIADWYTGKNRFGYASAGFGATLSTKNVLYVGYSFGNSGRGNNGLAIYFGRNF